MKRLLAVAALAVVSFPLHAQQPKPIGTVKEEAAITAERQARVEKLFAVMHLERTMQQMMGMMQQMVMQSTRSMPGMDALTPAQSKIVDDYQKKAMQMAADSVGWTAMKPDYVRIYANEFTDDQIDAITAFYSSPAGQALLDKTPEIGQQTMTIVQRRVATLQPQMRALMEDMTKQLKAATPAAAPKTPPAGSK